MNLSGVLNVLGRVSLVFAVLLLLPLVMVAIDGDGPVSEGAVLDVSAAFLWASAAAAALGLVLIVLFRLDKDDFDHEEGFAVVSFSWALFTVLGALPYVLSGAIPGVVDATFESLSGLTTTGASILSDPALLGRPLLFWRALTHWVGGMGIVALSVAILPTLGAGGAFLYRAEGGSPDRGNLFPRVADVARRLWVVYIGLTVVQIVSLLVAGMGAFDSVCHTFATVATGGFGTRADSMASFSPAIQWVTTFFMLVSGLNLLLLAAAMSGRSIDLLRNTETRVYLAIVLVAFVLGVGILHDTPSAPEGLEPLLRGVAFSVVSVISTTGFGTEDFVHWPVALHVILVMLMLSGACSGSTSGSAKVVRHVIWAKAAWRELGRLLRPNGVFVVKVDGRDVPEALVNRSVSYLMFFLGTALLGTLVLALLGVDGETAFSSVITCIANVGPGLGSVGPQSNFGALDDVSKVVLMACMILGRLEFYALLVLASPLAWRR